eukprot:scaffold526_cov230-Pinguiococcus_pyrenoidosus.AAC.13
MGGREGQKVAAESVRIWAGRSANGEAWIVFESFYNGVVGRNVETANARSLGWRAPSTDFGVTNQVFEIAPNGARRFAADSAKWDSASHRRPRTRPRPCDWVGFRVRGNQ